MEHDVPQIHGVGRYYFILGFITAILIKSCGLRWNYFYDMTGILIPAYINITLGIGIALIFGYYEKIEDKPNIYMMIFYPIGFLISFIICYLFLNSLVSSIKIKLAIGLITISLLPGFGLIKLYQFLYNRKLEDKYWDDLDKMRREKGEPTLSDHLNSKL